MCGIAGLIKRETKVCDYEKTELDAMLSRIRHRGPDDSGCCGFREKELCLSNWATEQNEGIRGILGFNRLSIQDLSEAGHQPMCSEDRQVVITFNGEIYNVEELKTILRNDGMHAVYHGHSDTEVILNCYISYGMEKMLRMLNGMFAIALLDIRKQMFYIARDRVGIIPCHIMITNERIVWSSEIKAFLELSDFNRKVRESALSDAIKFCYPNRSMYEQIENVEPGTYFSYSLTENVLNKFRFFSLEEFHERRRISVEECGKVLKDCLQRQLISDVPLGVQLSGGVDSTLLAKYTSDIYASRDQELYGFSLVNRQFDKFSEEKWIDQAADQLKVNIQKYDFNADIFAQNFEKSIYAYERFVNIPSPVGIYTFSSEAKRHVTVLISGEGADELAGGYSAFSFAKVCEFIDKYHGAGLISSAMKHYPIENNEAFVKTFDSMLSDENSKRLFPNFSIDESVAAKRDFLQNASGSAFERLRKLYFKEELVSLLERQNKVCMASSVENRVPFLDNRFLELLFSAPEEQLLHRQFTKAIRNRKKEQLYEGKYLLKQLSASIYGSAFAYRTKQAVRVPLKNYIMNPKFQDYMNDFILPGMKTRELLNFRVFKNAYSNMDSGENTMIVWKAINFEAWMQLFVDGRMPVEYS